MKREKLIINDPNMYEYFEEEAYMIFSKLCQEEEDTAKGPNQLSFYGVNRIYKSLSVIYETEDVEEELCLIENVLNILDSYVKIEGLEHLLINNYASIENGIFLEHSPDGNPKRIREHYKHQFRNAYLGLLMLDRLHIDDCIVECFMDECSEYANYVMSSLDKTRKSDKREQKEILKEIIYKTYLISALFHDIGYPLAYYFRIADEILEFTPFFKIINPVVKGEFTEIRAMLNNSLLFRTVDNKKISKKYQDSDHGCLSALSFLMNFYFSGSIYNFASKERCIIEMAAIAIFKHTDRYDDRNRMLFSHDPISYLLRVCDDMQEWQRFLTVIGRTHNYLQCNICGKIIKPDEKDSDLYSCNCGKQFYKITQMDNKKINYIDICDALTLEAAGNRITISFMYNVYSQLELLVNDYEAVIYRAKGLERLEHMLSFQKYFPEIQLQYFLSNNPIALIEDMMAEKGKDLESLKVWVLGIESETKRKNMEKFLECFENGVTNKERVFGKQLEKNSVRYAREARQFVEDYMGEIHMLKNYLDGF